MCTKLNSFNENNDGLPSETKPLLLVRMTLDYYEDIDPKSQYFSLAIESSVFKVYGLTLQEAVKDDFEAVFNQMRYGGKSTKKDLPRYRIDSIGDDMPFDYYDYFIPSFDKNSKIFSILMSDEFTFNKDINLIVVGSTAPLTIVCRNITYSVSRGKPTQIILP